MALGALQKAQDDLNEVGAPLPRAVQKGQERDQVNFAFDEHLWVHITLWRGQRQQGRCVQIQVTTGPCRRLNVRCNPFPEVTPRTADRQYSAAVTCLK
jgi:hypothetical protein